jgi:hypothetical protein
VTLVLTRTAAAVLRATAYHAMVDGHGVVTTALARMAAARTDPVWALRVLGRGTVATRYHLDRQPRPPGEPMVDPGFRYAAELREAHWRAAGTKAHELFVVPDPVWGKDFCAALDRAESVAVGRWLGMPELLFGLLDGPGTEPAWQRLHAGGFRADTTPYAPYFATAEPLGAIETRAPSALPWVPRLLGRFLEKSVGGPVFTMLEEEARRQAVRLGHDVVQSSTVLLAILGLDDQMRLTDCHFTGRYWRSNDGAARLAARGLTLESAGRAAEPIVLEQAAPPSGDPSRMLFAMGGPADPVWSREAIALLEEAGRVARRNGLKAYGTTHIVAALAETPAPAAQRLLAAFGPA